MFHYFFFSLGRQSTFMQSTCYILSGQFPYQIHRKELNLKQLMHPRVKREATCEENDPTCRDNVPLIYVNSNPASKQRDAIADLCYSYFPFCLTIKAIFIAYIFRILANRLGISFLSVNQENRMSLEHPNLSANSVHTTISSLLCSPAFFGMRTMKFINCTKDMHIKAG